MDYFLRDIDNLFDYSPGFSSVSRSSGIAWRSDGDNYQLSLTLPDGVNLDEVKAEIKNGVFSVTIPKKNETKTVDVEISK
jgi:HSP20 family molecular chaperone IbpA